MSSATATRERRSSPTATRPAGRCWWSARGVGEEWADGCLGSTADQAVKTAIVMCCVVKPGADV